MCHHQADSDQRNLPMKVVDDVFAPRLGDEAEARGEAELQAHHREAGVADRSREFSPEVARGRQPTQKQREQRAEHEQKIQSAPNNSAQGEALRHSRRHQNDPNALPSAIAMTSAISGPTTITIAMSR